MNINGYELITEWTEAGNGDWAFAKKDSVEYFIKKFPKPKYPMPGKHSPTAETNMKAACAEWESRQNKLISTLKEIGGGDGSLVIPVDFFREGASYYKVTLRINAVSSKESEISELNHNEKIKLMKSFSLALGTMHRKGIIHGDIKPDNVIVTESSKGVYAARLIDFDDSYFEGDPPKPEETVGTPEYYSPELGTYIMDGSGKGKKTLTCKSDVFSAGLLFHQYYSGADVDIGKKKAHQVVDVREFKINPTIPPRLKELLLGMLDPNPNMRPPMADVIRQLDSCRSSKADTVDSMESIKKTPIAEKRIHPLKFVLTGATMPDAPSHVSDGSSLELKLVPTIGMELPRGIIVSMAGKRLLEGEDYAYNRYTGIFSMSSVTGSLLVTVTGIPKVTSSKYTVTVLGKGIESEVPDAVGAGSPLFVSLSASESIYSLPLSIKVSMDGRPLKRPLYSYYRRDREKGTITIPTVTGNVVVEVNGIDHGTKNKARIILSASWIAGIMTAIWVAMVLFNSLGGVNVGTAISIFTLSIIPIIVGVTVVLFPEETTLAGAIIAGAGAVLHFIWAYFFGLFPFVVVSSVTIITIVYWRLFGGKTGTSSKGKNLDEIPLHIAEIGAYGFGAFASLWILSASLDSGDSMATAVGIGGTPLMFIIALPLLAYLYGKRFFFIVLALLACMGIVIWGLFYFADLGYFDVFLVGIAASSTVAVMAVIDWAADIVKKY